VEVNQVVTPLHQINKLQEILMVIQNLAAVVLIRHDIPIFYTPDKRQSNQPLRIAEMKKWANNVKNLQGMDVPNWGLWQQTIIMLDLVQVRRTYLETC
jgi:hypothetical protein